MAARKHASCVPIITTLPEPPPSRSNLAQSQSSPVAAIGVLSGIDGHALVAAPAHAEGERVAVLQQLAKPAVPLEAQLQEAAPLLRRRQAADQQRLRRVPVLQQLAGDACTGSVEFASSRVSSAAWPARAQGPPALCSCHNDPSICGCTHY